MSEMVVIVFDCFSRLILEDSYDNAKWKRNSVKICIETETVSVYI